MTPAIGQPVRLDSSSHFKVLGDPRRLAILQLLMAQPATLTQLGQILGDHPAKVRYHLKTLEEAGLVALTATKVVGGFVEKYYSASSKAYLVNLALVPKHPSVQSLCLMGSHDLALNILSERLRSNRNSVQLTSFAVGSLDGLIAMRQDFCQLAAAHLPDRSSNTFNEDSVRLLFPGEPVTLATLAHRVQGLLVEEGNPLGVTGLADLGRNEIQLINRQPGSGTRAWLDRQLRNQGMDTDAVSGYSNFVTSHLQVAESVASGLAQVGIALQAASNRFRSSFIPLFRERFDIILYSRYLDLAAVQILLEELNSTGFRKQIEELGGYDTASTGETREINE